MASEPSPQRSLWVAPTYQVLLTGAFSSSARQGGGLAGSYDFHLSPRLSLGLDLAYRFYPGNRVTQQLGYGLLIKHFFSDDWARSGALEPFVDYGLLQQQSFVSGTEGRAISHDTRLGGGVLCSFAGGRWFAALAAHYSSLTHFGVRAQAIPYAEAQLGWLHAL